MRLRNAMLGDRCLRYQHLALLLPVYDESLGLSSLCKGVFDAPSSPSRQTSGLGQESLVLKTDMRMC